jgi:predicted alpha/beta-hydrolase family hydrolase
MQFDSIGETENSFWATIRNKIDKPWYIIEEQARFNATDRWTQAKYSYTLMVFARREDNDDIACLEIKEETMTAIVLIHGWMSEGFIVMGGVSNGGRVA